MASQLLDGGRTAHSALKIPIPVHEESTCAIDLTSQLAGEAMHTAHLILDELVTSHCHNPESVDCSLQDVLRSKRPFVRQMLAVVRAGNRFQIVRACLRSLQLFSLFKTLHLYKNMRLQALSAHPNPRSAALEFPSYLLCLRGGKLKINQKEPVHLPSPLTLYCNISDMIHRVLSNSGEIHRNEEWMWERAIISMWIVWLQYINYKV